MWALNYYLTQLSLGCQSSCQQTPRGLETRCGREGHTRPRGPSESPDGVDANIRRTIKTQRNGHNSGVKIWSLCSVSSTLSHANLTNKVRGKYIWKEVFLRLCPWVCFIIVSLGCCGWLYNMCMLELFWISPRVMFPLWVCVFEFVFVCVCMCGSMVLKFTDYYFLIIIVVYIYIYMCVCVCVCVRPYLYVFRLMLSSEIMYRKMIKIYIYIYIYIVSSPDTLFRDITTLPCG